MQHIEEAGVHSGDSACVIPPHSLPGPVIDEIKRGHAQAGPALKVKGLMNIQFAVKKEDDRLNVYVLEVNPRASRTVPFVSKATGVPLASWRPWSWSANTLDELGYDRDPIPSHFSVKESVFPFNKFPGVDIILGPGNAFDRRSDGRQRSLLDGVCQEPAGGRRRCCPSGQHLHQPGRRTRSTWSDWGAAVELGFELRRHRGHGEALTGRLRCRPSRNCRRGIPTCSTI